MPLPALVPLAIAAAKYGAPLAAGYFGGSKAGAISSGAATPQYPQGSYSPVAPAPGGGLMPIGPTQTRRMTNAERRALGLPVFRRRAVTMQTFMRLMMVSKIFGKNSMALQAIGMKLSGRF